ncbi:MAG: hypothetical protein EZS28_022338, partial [Streblomastix strix]
EKVEKFKDISSTITKDQDRIQQVQQQLKRWKWDSKEDEMVMKGTSTIHNLLTSGTVENTKKYKQTVVDSKGVSLLISVAVMQMNFENEAEKEVMRKRERDRQQEKEREREKQREQHRLRMLKRQQIKEIKQKGSLSDIQQQVIDSEIDKDKQEEKQRLLIRSQKREKKQQQQQLQMQQKQQEWENKGSPLLASNQINQQKQGNEGDGFDGELTGSDGQKMPTTADLPPELLDLRNFYKLESQMGDQDVFDAGNNEKNLIQKMSYDDYSDSDDDDNLSQNSENLYQTKVNDALKSSNTNMGSLSKVSIPVQQTSTSLNQPPNVFSPSFGSTQSPQGSLTVQQQQQLSLMNKQIYQNQQLLGDEDFYGENSSDTLLMSMASIDAIIDEESGRRALESDGRGVEVCVAAVKKYLHLIDYNYRILLINESNRNRKDSQVGNSTHGAVMPLRRGGNSEQLLQNQKIDQQALKNNEIQPQKNKKDQIQVEIHIIIQSLIEERMWPRWTLKKNIDNEGKLVKQGDIGICLQLHRDAIVSASTLISGIVQMNRSVATDIIRHCTEIAKIHSQQQTEIVNNKPVKQKGGGELLSRALQLIVEQYGNESPRLMESVCDIFYYLWINVSPQINFQEDPNAIGILPQPIMKNCLHVVEKYFRIAPNALKACLRCLYQTALTKGMMRILQERKILCTLIRSMEFYAVFLCVKNGYPIPENDSTNATTFTSQDCNSVIIASRDDDRRANAFNGVKDAEEIIKYGEYCLSKIIRLLKDDEIATMCSTAYLGDANDIGFNEDASRELALTSRTEQSDASYPSTNSTSPTNGSNPRQFNTLQSLMNVLDVSIKKKEKKLSENITRNLVRLKAPRDKGSRLTKLLDVAKDIFKEDILKGNQV